MGRPLSSENTSSMFPLGEVIVCDIANMGNSESKAISFFMFCT